MLPRPIIPIFWIGIVKIDANPRITAGRKFLPGKWISQLAFDLFLLRFKQMKVCFSFFATNIELGTDLIAPPKHGRAKPEADSADAVIRPRSWPGFSSRLNRAIGALDDLL